MDEVNQRTPGRRKKNITIGLIILAIMGIFAVVYLMDAKPKAEPAPKGHVSLGPMEYNFSNGKAIKRADATTAKLRQFLEKQVEKEIRVGGDNCPHPEYDVIAVNKAENQVLVGYGCVEASARMFAVLKDNAWKTVSPTNNFDMFNIPDCIHVDDNKISTEIAPVCVERPLDTTSPPTYKVRSSV